MKFLRVALCFFLLLCLVGCSSASVEDLLTAPALSDGQRDVLQSLGDGVGSDNIVLRYPRFGSSRAPIQFADLDADGSDEAIAFFSSSDGNTYPSIAILSRDSEGVWHVAGEISGSGSEVYSVNMISLSGSDKMFVLVEWTTASSGRRISVYTYENNTVSIGFEDSCVRIVFEDMDNDGSLEFCYITDQSSGDSYKIKYVDSSESGLSTVAEYQLNIDTLSVMSAVFGLLSDGTPAVFVDEDLGDANYTTEIFYISSGKFNRLDVAGGYKVTSLLNRTGRLSSDVSLVDGAVVAVPSDTPSGAVTAFPETWTYWYTLSAESVECVVYSYVNTEYQFALSIPEHWFETSLVTQSEDSSGRFIVTDIETGETLCQLHVLAVGEDDSAIVDEGFTQALVSGSYRYYMRYNCRIDEQNYILNNFRTL